MGRIDRLYVWPINDMSAAYKLCVSNIQSEPMHHVFVCATHISKCSGPRRSKKSNFICRDEFIKCHISQVRPRNGSPWLATGSYFVRTEPRPPRSFLYRSRTPKLNNKNKIMKLCCVLCFI